MRPDEVTVKQLADEFGVGLDDVHCWIKKGVVEARQLDGRGPMWIKLED